VDSEAGGEGTLGQLPRVCRTLTDAVKYRGRTLCSRTSSLVRRCSPNRARNHYVAGHLAKAHLCARVSIWHG
jgi:hypothetical protein